METTIKTLEAELTMADMDLYLAREHFADLMARAIVDGEEIAESVLEAARMRVTTLTDRVRRIADQISYRTPSGYATNYYR